jgi:hypothetical protein
MAQTFFLKANTQTRITKNLITHFKRMPPANPHTGTSCPKHNTVIILSPESSGPGKGPCKKTKRACEKKPLSNLM